MTTINTTHGFASSQAEEDALVLEGALVIIRTDLLPDAPPDAPELPSIVFELDCENLVDLSGKTVTNNGVTSSNGEADFSSGYLVTPDHNDLDFNDDEFEIVMNIKYASLNTGGWQTLLSKGTSNTNCWYISHCTQSGSQYNGKIELVSQNQTIRIIGNSGISDTTEFHEVKLKKVGSTVTLYVDEVVIGTTGVAPLDTTGSMFIGAWAGNQSSSRFTGKMNLLKVIR